MENKDIKLLHKMFDRKVNQRMGSNAKQISMTAEELKKINQLIKHPMIQSTLSDDKVVEMSESYKDTNPYNYFFLSCNLITIAHMVVGDKEDYYLVDGQHRLQMVMDSNELCSSLSFIVTIIIVRSKTEMDMLFQNINKDSAKCLIKDYPIFAEQMYQELKELLQSYNIFLPRKASTKSRLYTLSEFIDILIRKNIIVYLDNCMDSKQIYDYLVKKEKEYFNAYGYKAKSYQHSNGFKVMEENSIANHSCMFMKNNNFIDWLIDYTLVPTHDLKKRPHISKELSTMVWQKYHNVKLSEKCPIYGCNRIMDIHISNSWQCGHIKSFNNGGETTIDNMKPICPDCNRKMSDMDWTEYEYVLMKKKILEDYEYFDDIISIQCHNKKQKCKNMITKDNYEVGVGKKNLIPICYDCYFYILSKN